MDIQISLSILIPVVLGIVQAVKMAGLNERYAPLLALALGVSGVFLVTHVVAGQNVVSGLIIGLSAVGLWSGVKNTFAAQ